ncbi:MAG: hypothetical protein R3B48_19235 [Kofleriaceae bacterium]
MRLEARRSLLCCTLALSIACDRGSKAKPALGEPGGQASGSASAAPPAETTAGLAAKTWSDAACTPSADAAVKQRAGTATIALRGDGLDERHERVPALCGGLHTEATKRFAVGDGTLFRACLPGGARVQISADVALSGPVSTEFTYENYKKTGPLIELYRPDAGTYNQRDVPTAEDKLTIAFDWSTVELAVAVQWPSKPERLVQVTAQFDCGGPLR